MIYEESSVGGCRAKEAGKGMNEPPGSAQRLRGRVRPLNQRSQSMQ